MKHPTRIAAFRAGLRQWQALGPKATPEAKLVDLAREALLEAEAIASQGRQIVMARCRAAIGAIQSGAPGDAQRILETAIAEAERPPTAGGPWTRPTTRRGGVQCHKATG